MPGPRTTAPTCCRMNRGRTTAAAAAGVALLLTGCAGGDDPTLTAPPAPPPATTGQPGGTASGAPPATGGATDGSTLLALVGTKDQPEAFEISLTDSSGAPITQLRPGTYTISVTDQAETHNFALRGEGVRLATDVDGKENPTWRVDLRPGDYTFVCDPHPSSMSGSFVVA